MPEKATFSRALKECTSEASRSVDLLRASWTDSAQTLQKELSSRIDGWPGIPRVDISPVETRSWSIWGIVGSIVAAVRRGRARLSVRSYFAERPIGWIHLPGVIWSELKKGKTTRREVTEELSCRTSVGSGSD